MSTKHLISSLAVAGSLAAAFAAPASAATVDAQASTSANWSGYAVGSGNSDQQFSSVSGSWTEPSANCNAGQGVASFWVGLGGAGQQSQALEQTGTEIDCTGGSPQHSAWYEVVPAAPVKFNLAISAGDHMSATVSVSGNNVTMSLKDDTTGQSASKTLQADNVDLSSAEWIAEAPSQCDGGGCTPLPLADFGKVNFTNASATAGGHTGPISDSSWQAQPVELSPSADGGVVLPGGGIGVSSDSQTSSAGAEPADLSSDGSAFSVSWVGDASQLSSGGAGSTTGSAGAGGSAGDGYGPGGYGSDGYGAGGYGSGGYGDSGAPGYGSGSGYGDGSGYGSGYGDGSGYGSGYGDGSGYGSGYGDGSGGAAVIGIGDGGYYIVTGGYGY